MTTLLWLWTAISAVIGLAHALYVYRLMRVEAPAESTAGNSRAGYYALWTFGLWLLLGVYILGMWLIASLFWLIFKAGR